MSESAPRSAQPGGSWTTEFCGMPFSAIDAATVIDYLEQRRSDDPFGYVVTPNVDHVVRAWRDPEALHHVYAGADLSLCDSRILGLVARATGVKLPVVPGSDLTGFLFEYVLNPFERVTIVGGDEDMLAKLRARYKLRNIRHYNPPMGFIRNKEAVQEAIAFVERSPARFIFMAVGSPQQEVLSYLIKERGQATGTALCVGASLLFLTGDLQRAPAWMQRARIEWLHRLSTEPRRLWRRYLVEGPKVFGLAASELAARNVKQEVRVDVSIVIPTFRREHLLPRLLERCAGQGGLGPQALEILVVDNTPEASARPIVENALAGAPLAVRYLHEPRPGISHARNRGIAEARGEFIAFIDDDELPSPEWLESLMRTQRTYRADAVLGPVRPIFSQAPRQLVGTFRQFFSQVSEAPTGTPIAPTSFFKPRSGATCHRPLASNNALLVRSRCFEGPEPFDPALGLTGGEDTLFFTKLHRGGRRIVWCKEALVHERIPPARLNVRFMLRRKFRDGQITSSTCLLLNPPDRLQLAGWVAVGLAQLGIGSAIGLLAYLPKRQLGLRGFCMAATGLGKVLFFGKFRGHSYGARVTAPAPAA